MKEKWERPELPLDEYRKQTQRLSQLAFLRKYGGEVSREDLNEAFANAFTSLDDLMDDFGITFREIFGGDDVEVTT